MRMKHVLFAAGVATAILATACSPKQEPASDVGSAASGDHVSSSAEAPPP